jgi:hypothetical protein
VPIGPPHDDVVDERVRNQARGHYAGYGRTDYAENTHQKPP